MTEWAPEFREKTKKTPEEIKAHFENVVVPYFNAIVELEDKVKTQDE